MQKTHKDKNSENKELGNAEDTKLIYSESKELRNAEDTNLINSKDKELINAGLRNTMAVDRIDQFSC